MKRAICAIFLFLCTYNTAYAHSWYPWECCSGMDCAPVEKFSMTPNNEWMLTSKHGTVIIPAQMKRRESKDNRFHVCMRKAEGITMPLCVFVPPGM